MLCFMCHEMKASKCGLNMAYILAEWSQQENM